MKSQFGRMMTSHLKSKPFPPHPRAEHNHNHWTLSVGICASLGIVIWKACPLLVIPNPSILAQWSPVQSNLGQPA